MSHQPDTPWQNPPHPLLLNDSKKRGRFNSAEDARLAQTLQDLGVVSRGELTFAKRQPTKQELIGTLHEFLLTLVPLGARAVVNCGQPLDHPELLTVPETGYIKSALLEALD